MAEARRSCRGNKGPKGEKGFVVGVRAADGSEMQATRVWDVPERKAREELPQLCAVLDG